MTNRDKIPPAKEYRKTEKPVKSAVINRRRICMTQTCRHLKVKTAIIITKLARPTLAPGAKAKKGGKELSIIPITTAAAVNRET